MLIGLKSKQGDLTADFLHSDLCEDEKVFVDMPVCFKLKGKNGRNKVLKFKKTLYGLRQIPRAFWKYMTYKIELCGMLQTNMDPCLFIDDKFMAVIYVDDFVLVSGCQ